ncbi:sigma 54-interacting transcriptional regulator [bacterium 210820-DFI.6.37]|nr:sigma 54-interacting transcriptional regulator [bacterium 210820-DFI.6.37]
MVSLPKIFNEDWRNFFEVSHDGILVADSQGRIVYMNPAAERMEEVEKESILGRYAKELLEEGIYQVSVTVKVFQTKRKETVMQYKGGRQLVITGIPIFDGTSIKWVYINERDVTELNQIKQDEKNARMQLAQYKAELQRIQNNENKEMIIVTNSPKMKQNMELMKRLAPTETSILIEGESGVGKDVHARWIHNNSMRASKPYIKIDCGALSENLLESELFGYEEGAFTGARKHGKKGLAEEADGGTLFLDEIGELPLNLQTKLLRLVQEKAFIPVGGTEAKHVDIRIIAATNKDLKEMVKEKSFRQDLYYRLNVIPLKLPPLRERKEDLFNFIQHFLKVYNEKHGYRKKVSTTAVNALCSYSWPGNVRELSNIMERLVVVTPKALIESDDVLQAIPDYDGLKLKDILAANRSYEDAIARFEKEYFQHIMRESGTLKETAEAIGVSESTLKRKLKKYSLRPRDPHE